MQQVHKNSILNKFKFSDILYVGQDPRFAQEYAYKQCYLLRRASVSYTHLRAHETP